MAGDAALPAIVRLRYEAGRAAFSLDAAPPSLLTAAIFQGAPSGKEWIASTTTEGQAGQIAVEPTKLEPGRQYTVALTLDPEVTPVVWGPATVLVFEQPEVQTARVAGGSLEIGWRLPASTSVIGVSAAIYDRKAENVVVSESFAQEGAPTGRLVQAGARLVPPVPLDPERSYGVYLVGWNGVAGGPTVWLQSDLLLSAPALAGVAYGAKPGGGFAMTVTPATVPVSPVTAVACLLRDGRVEGEVAVAGKSAEIKLSEALDPSAGWRVGFLCRNGVLSGPLGPTVEIPLAQPRLTEASWGGSEFALEWTLPGCSGAAVSIRRSDGVEVGSAEVPEGRRTTVTPGTAIEPSAEYEVQLAPILGSARGRFGGAAPLIVASPTIAAVRCEAGQAEVSLAGTGNGGVDASGAATILELRSAGSTILTAPAGPAGGLLTLPEDGFSPLAVTARWVRAGEGAVHGPSSEPVGLLTGAPELTSAEGTPASCALTWRWPGGEPTDPSPSKYELLLVEGDAETVLGTQSAPAGKGTAPLTATPPPGARIAVRALAGAASGPRGAGAPILTAAPALRSVEASPGGAVVKLMPPGPPGERCLVSVVGGGKEAGSAWSEGGRAVVPLSGVSAGTLYSVRAVAAAAGGTAKGPAATLQALLVAPTLSAPAFDGEGITLTVAPPDAGGVDTTAYRVELLRDGVVVQREAAVVPSQGKLAVPAGRVSDPAARLVLRATPLAASAVGPPATVDLLLAAPIVASAAVVGSTGSRTVNATVDTSGFAAEASFEAVVIADGVAGTPVPVTGGRATIALPASATTAAVAARGKTTAASGPWSLPVPVPVAAPAVTARRDGPAVSVWWSGDATAEHRVALLAGSTKTVAAETVVVGLSASLPAALDPTLAYEVEVLRLAGPAIGPPGTTALLAAAPVLTSCAFSAAGGGLAMGWQAVPGAAGYDLELRRDGAATLQRQPTTNSLALTAGELPGAGIYELRIRATQSAGGELSAGPWSEPARVALRAPGGVRVAYDGRRAGVSWDPLPGPDAVGYVVTVLAGDEAKAMATVEGTSASLAVRFEAAAGATAAVVQALTVVGAGPPSERVPLFAPGLYPSTTKQKPPYLVPATTPAMEEADVVVQLPQIFTTPPAKEALPTAPPFAMAQAEAPFSYALTMAAKSAVWKFEGEAIRKEVSDAYAALLKALTNLNVTPLGWHTVQDAIARSMPQTFAETLLYGCGLEEGCVDLVPGMVLRAEYQGYQYLGPDAAESELLDGFLTTAAVEYEVGSYVSASAQWLTGFDAFLGRLATTEGTAVQAPRTTPAGASGGGGVADLYYTQFRRPFCRLVYPPQLASPSEPGSPQPAFNVAVIAGDDYPTLLAASANLRDNRPLGSGVALAYLRGRTTLSACLRVWLDGVPSVVPLGTTVGNLLEGMGRRPPLLDGLPLDGLRLVRGTGAAILDAGVGKGGYAVGSGQTIHLDWGANTAYDAATDVLALPLLPGDRLVTGA